MSSRLDLPPERDLPGSRHREIRTALVRATRPARRRPHAWLVALPVAVLAVVLGLLLAQPWNRTPPVVGVPSTSPSPSPSPSESIDWSVEHGRKPVPNPAIPSAAQIDRGELGDRARSKAVARCLSDLDRRTSVEVVHLARKTSSDGDVVIFTARDGQSYLCAGSGSSAYAGSGSKTAALPAPSRKRPVVRILAPGIAAGRGAHGPGRSTTGTAYRVGNEVASLQMRLTVLGHTGPWFEASVAGGYAWATASVDYANPNPLDHDDDAYEVEDRAFDADGKELAIDRTPR